MEKLTQADNSKAKSKSARNIFYTHYFSNLTEINTITIDVSVVVEIGTCLLARIWRGSDICYLISLVKNQKLRF